MTPKQKWHYSWSRGRVKLIDECTVNIYITGKSYWGHVSPINTNPTFVDNDGEDFTDPTKSQPTEHIATKFQRLPHISDVNPLIGAAVHRRFRHLGISVKDGVGRLCHVRNLVKPRLLFPVDYDERCVNG